MASNSAPIGISSRGLLRASAVVLVPSIEIPLLFWTRLTYGDLHPAEVSKTPPTISAALGEPAVADPFAMIILLIAALTAVSVTFIVRAYSRSINMTWAVDQRKNTTAGLLLLFCVLAQAAGTLGMVVTSWVPLGVDRNIHMISSYVFFAGQSLAVLGSGILGHMLRSGAENTGEFGTRVNSMHGMRFKAAVAIAVLALGYLLLFWIKDFPMAVDNYVVRYVYSSWEIVLLASFVIYLGLFAPDLYWMEQTDLQRKIAYP
jgi:hypothetical protein